MASVKEAFGTETAFTVTNFLIGTSATAGWMSNAIDNSSNLYLDALVQADLKSAAWTAGNAVYFYAYGWNGSFYTSTGDGQITGSEGTVTLPNVTTQSILLPQLGIVACPITNKELVGGPWSVAACFGGILPVKWGVAMINNGGATLAASSTIKYVEVYNTVA